MPRFGPAQSPGIVGRRFLAGATVLAAIGGIAGDSKWLGAAAALGTAWWGWDFLCDNVFGPLGRLLTAMITGTSLIEQGPDLSVDDRIRLLENNLAGDGVTRHVQIQSALRLAEIYQLTRKDPAKAREVIERAKEKWPDAPELKLFEDVMGEG